MKKIPKSLGLNQVGGKSRLVKTLLNYTPPHQFFISLFCGACWYEINKPRSKYECFNDLNSEIINYLIVIEKNYEEFMDYKKGFYGIVSEKIFNDIKNGEIIPKNNIEKAVQFHYLNKIGFGGKLKANKSQFRGFDLKDYPKCEENNNTNNIVYYRGITSFDTNGSDSSTQNAYGLITPIDKGIIDRLHYVNISNRDFKEIYNIFLNKFYIERKINKEVFIFADPPYPIKRQDHYRYEFSEENHKELIQLMLESPFLFCLTIGGNCEFYLEQFKNKENWIIKPIILRYSINNKEESNKASNESKEYIIMNYDITKTGVMKNRNYKNLNEYIER